MTPPPTATAQAGLLALPAKARMTYISLFSGIGGFDLGFDRAGMHCAGQVEWDKKARALLGIHWPHVKQYEDVRNVGKHNLPAVDLICGGFPCQDVSVAGRRAGLAGVRSGLWFEFHRIIKELSPRWVVIENVPGLLSSNSGRDFATVIQGLVECGYGVCWRVLDSQYFGLAQRRKRVFIVAGLTAAGCNPAQVLFERDGGYGDTPPRRTPGEGTTPYVIKGAAINREPENGPQYGEISNNGTTYTLNTSEVHAIADTSPAHTERMRGFGDYTEDDQASSLRARDGKDATDLVALTGWDYQGRNVYSSAGDTPALTAGGNSPHASGGTHVNILIPETVDTTGHQGDRVISPDGVWPTLSAESANNGGGANASAFAPIAFQFNAGASVGMGIAENISPTLQLSNPPAGQRAGYGVRRLTPTECERLQGFPDGHTAVNQQADSARYKQLGNAVSVPVAEWIGRRIVEAETA